MGRNTAEEQNRRSNPKHRSAGERRVNRLFTYHPTQEHREALKRDGLSLDRAVELLGERVEAGLKIVISSPLDRDSFSVIARENLDNWELARGVSVWHRSLDRALIGLAFYLVNVNPEWPDTLAPSQVEDIDW